MNTHTEHYRLPDQGFTLVRWAHDLARGPGAVVVEAEVERVRRPDGALAAADLSRFGGATDGPLSVLRKLLELEATAVGRWSRDGFGRFHKRAARRHTERVCHQQGIEAAVGWALANGSNDRLNLDALRDMLGARLYDGGFDEQFLRPALARSLHERRKQRRLNG